MSFMFRFPEGSKNRKGVKFVIHLLNVTFSIDNSKFLLHIVILTNTIGDESVPPV